MLLQLLHTVSSEVFRSLPEYEFATFYFDENTCEIAMRIFFVKWQHSFLDFRHLTIFSSDFSHFS